MSEKEHFDTFVRIIEKTKIGMITTLSTDGRLLSRPLAVQQIDDEFHLWFFSRQDADLVVEIAANPKVNVCFSGGGEWLSVQGEAVTMVSLPKARELWDDDAAGWFPDGPDSTDLVLVRVHAETAEYWSAPGGHISAALSWAKSKITGEHSGSAESLTVKL